MCGIAGVFAYREGAPPVDEAELLRVRDHMVKRGPDGAGLWVSADRRVGLAHRRLAIIDLSQAGAQPMASADGNLQVTFNGEIYNYRALRKELEARGRFFRSKSDTEVLLHLYAEHGAEMLHKLRGMYAFGIWDARAHTLFLARDPFGIKPIYYADNGNTLRFASQVKALLAGGAVDVSPEPAGSVGFLIWGCVPEPFTLYRDIRALPAGSHLTLAAAAASRVTTHFSMREELLRAQDNPRPFRAQDRTLLGAVLRDSVRHHLVSDVPVGVFLSAGVDSSLVTALAAEEHAVSLRTLTLGFEEYRGTAYDEVPLAELTAQRRDTQHETHWIRSSDFEGELEPILAAMDQPTTDGVNTYLVCREAARAGIKVALSGLGGDELFGGYPSFRDVPRLARWLRPARLVPLAGRLLRRALVPLTSTFASPKYAGVLEYGGSYEGAYFLRRALFMPWEVDEVLDPANTHVGLERLRALPMLAETIAGIDTARAKVAALEMTWYLRNQLLRDADWAGMAHSVEVRVPLVDVALFRALAPWLVSAMGPAKADAAAVPCAPLALELLTRPKSGFTVPVREWLVTAATSRRKSSRGLRDWAKRVLPPQPKLFRALVLVTDAFGGYGGIAKFNRDLLWALAQMPTCAEVVAVPRLVPAPMEALPPRVTYRAEATGSKFRFARIVVSDVLSGPFDLVIAGHINLVSLAAFAGLCRGSKTALVIYGIDAWTPHGSALVRACLPRIDRVISVSNVTTERFRSWSHVDPARLRLLPPCVDLEAITPGPRSPDLARELGLEGRRVVMTLGRLAGEKRYKGFDEVLEALPALARQIPNLSYLICGDGPDRNRLEQKAAALGVRDRVVFTGFVPERSKVDYYRLADVYVMPSRGEGFGIVFLEAMGCGVPVVGSMLDGSRDALRNGELGTLVDPRSALDVETGIRSALARTKGVPGGLSHFSVTEYRARLEAIVCDTIPPAE